MLIVCSLDSAQTAFTENSPSQVVSLLSVDETMPTFAGLPEEAHLKLYAERDDCSSAIGAAAESRARDIIAFLEKWDRQGNVLIHCNRGVSRSMAAAFITLCLLRPDDDEAILAKELRNAAPHADPCLLTVAYADDILDRDGRMIDAIQDLTPPCAEIEAPMLTLPIAA